MSSTLLTTRPTAACDQPACDYYQQEREHELLGLGDSPLHSIGVGFGFVELNQFDDRPWELFPTIPEEPTSARQVAQIIADLTTGQRMLADLNAARSTR